MKLFSRKDDAKAFIIHSLTGTESISYKELEIEIIKRKAKFKKNEILGFCDKVSLDLILDYISAIEAEALPCFISHPSHKISKEIFEIRIKNLKNLGITKIISKDFNIENNIDNIIENNNDILFIQTSSGTTNNQKAFCISEKKLFNQIKAYSKNIELNKDSIVASWLPLYHDMGLITSLFMPLYFGATSVIIPTFDWVLKNELLFECIDTFEATHCWMPNFAFNLMGNKEFILKNKKCKFYNCSEVCRKSSVEKFYKKYTNNIFVTYAMAENVFAVTVSDKIELDKEDEILKCGKCIDGTFLKIKNNEIFISGNSLFDAYLRNNKIIKLKNKWYNTNDIGKLQDKKLIVLGRNKDVCKINGKQINLLDIDFLCNEYKFCHPGRCVSFVCDDRLVILYESNEDRSLEISKIILDTFDISTKIEKIPNGKLIKTSSGKISRDLNLNLFKERELIRSFFNDELNNKNLKVNLPLRSSGAFDSFEFMELIYKVHLKIKKNINWKINYSSIDTIEEFIDAIQ